MNEKQEQILQYFQKITTQVLNRNGIQFVCICQEVGSPTMDMTSNLNQEKQKQMIDAMSLFMNMKRNNPIMFYD